MLQLKTATIVVLCVSQIYGRDSWCKWTEWECARPFYPHKSNCTAYRGRKCGCPAAEKFNAKNRSCTGPKEQFNKYAPKTSLCSGSTCGLYPTADDAGSPWCDWSQWSSWNVNCTSEMGVRRAVRYCLCQSEIVERNAVCSYGDREYINQTKSLDHGCRKEGKWCSWNPWQSCTGTCDKHNRTRVKTRTRTCTCPSPRYGGNHCKSYGKPAEEIISCCEEDNRSVNPIYIGAFVVFSVLVIIFIILRLYCYRKYQAHAANRSEFPLANTTRPPDINPATSPNSINAANGSYSRQAGQSQEYFNMAFVNLPPPYVSANEVAPPSYDELFQDETLTQEESTETSNVA